MLTCKKCSYALTRVSDFCPRCRSKIELSPAEIREMADAYGPAVANKEFESAVLYCRILANAGVLEFEREYARMLERGDLVEKDYDEAMKYFLAAAKKFDAWSAYKYSRLVSRGNDRAGRFWLLFSALLGCPEAYPKAAELLVKEGDQNSANYFYIQAANHDDVDSIVELASRYYKGTHLPQNENNAKWYMEKLNFPPLYALKLVYKLRGITPREPAEYNYDKETLIRPLAAEAAKCGFREAYYKLNTMLADYGDTDAIALVAMLLADGVGCEKNVDAAIRLFTEAAAKGSSEAYFCLAEMFIGGGYPERDPELAVHYYTEAGRLGSAEAYEALGTLYESGEFVEKNIALAEDHYSRAANLGSMTAGTKAEKIRVERQRFFREAEAVLAENPARAFRAYAIAAAMGHPKAPLKLAECYLRGRGTKPNRSAAFYWYKTAHELGDERATYPLALCYRHGIGVNRNYGKARALLSSAVDNGVEAAKETLAKLNAARIRKLARKLYSKGMRLIYRKKYYAAHKFLGLARELRDARAIYTLGALYEFGLGTETNRIAAGKLYDESFRLGFMDTGVEYKKIILKMIR